MSFQATAPIKKSPATLLAVLLTGALVSVLAPSANAAPAKIVKNAKCTKSAALAVATKTGATLKCNGKKWRGYKPATSVLAIASAAFSPKIARNNFSSGVSCVSPLGVTLPTRMSPPFTSAPM